MYHEQRPLMKETRNLPPEILLYIAQAMNLPMRGLVSVIELLDDGGTVPFIARYRKEATGNLDEVQIRDIAEKLAYFRELEDRRATILASIAETVSSTPADAVIYSDFRHGLFNRRTIPELIKAIPPNVYRVADSQVASRWGNITDFTDFDMVTPNEREARFALADQDSGIRPLASSLYDAARCKLLILKLGERGVLACRNSDHESLDSFFVIDSFVDRLVDAVGAGDALLAYTTLAMLVSRNEAVSTILGAFAAACECECDGNIPITADNVRGKIADVERQMNFA